MRNNVPKIHNMQTFDPKQIIMELDIWHYFKKQIKIDKTITKEIRFDPSYYFVTSGEAVEKITYMIIHIDEKTCLLLDLMAKSVMGPLHLKKAEAIKRIKSGKNLPKSLCDLMMYYQYMVDSKKVAKTLLALLKKFRGKNCFLETEWDSHRLLCIAKNPRLKEDVDE
jgi:hypothetical protein